MLLVLASSLHKDGLYINSFFQSLGSVLLTLCVNLTNKPLLRMCQGIHYIILPCKGP